MIYDDEAAGGPPSSQWGPWIPGQYPASMAPPPPWAPFHTNQRFGGLWLPPSADQPSPARGTPRWHLERLLRKLEMQWAGVSLYDDYFESRHRLAYTTAKFRDAFGALFNGFADNWCPIVVQSSVERMTVEGFRFGQSERDDDDAWAIWQANGLDAESRKLHTEAVKLGKASIYVDAGEDERYPRITVEHPSEVYIERDPSDRRRRLSAIKRWVDEDGHWLATVWLPDFVYRFRTAQPVSYSGDIRWVERPGVPFETHATVKGVIPHIPVDNDPSMLGGGQSDLKVGIPIQDAINKECNDMLVASEYAAYRQRVMTGVEQPKDPTTGQPIPIELGVTRLFTVEAPDAKVYDLQASDLKNYIQAVEMYVQHLAAQTHTPPHYLLGHMTNISGDALAAAETGLVAKVRSKLTDFSEPWEEAMRLAFRIRGTDEDLERANATDAQTLWRDPESRSFAQTVDGVVKLKEIGVPQEVLWERAGFSPQERARMRSMQAFDELLAATENPAPADTSAPVRDAGV